MLDRLLQQNLAPTAAINRATTSPTAIIAFARPLRPPPPELLLASNTGVIVGDDVAVCDCAEVTGAIEVDETVVVCIDEVNVLEALLEVVWEELALDGERLFFNITQI